MAKTMKIEKIVQKKNFSKLKISYLTLILMLWEAQKNYFRPYNRTNKENRKIFQKKKNVENRKNKKGVLFLAVFYSQKMGRWVRRPQKKGSELRFSNLLQMGWKIFYGVSGPNKKDLSSQNFEFPKFPKFFLLKRRGAHYRRPLINPQTLCYVSEYIIKPVCWIGILFE